MCVYSEFVHGLCIKYTTVTWIIFGGEPFSSYLEPLFQNEFSCRTFRMKMSLISIKMSLKVDTFLCERFRTTTRTRFDTEAKGNSEIACSFNIDVTLNTD